MAHPLGQARIDWRQASCALEAERCDPPRARVEADSGDRVSHFLARDSWYLLEAIHWLGSERLPLKHSSRTGASFVRKTFGATAVLAARCSNRLMALTILKLAGKNARSRSAGQ